MDRRELAELDRWIEREEDDHHEPARKAPAAKMRVECLECGHKFKTSSMDPRCSQCGSVDIEPA